MATLRSIDLKLADRLEDRDFRREWFRADLEASVPEKFRELREYRNLTQSELAEESGMKQSAISRFESSRDARWKFETLVTLAEAMDAQIHVEIVPAEDVIAAIRRHEADGSRGPGSVLNAAERNALRQDEFNPQPPRASVQYRELQEDKHYESAKGSSRWS